MIGLKLPARKRARDEAEKPFWISFADLMTALMVLFLVSVTVALFAVTQKPDEVATQEKKRKQEIQWLIDEIKAAAKDYPGIAVGECSEDRRECVIDFGDRARFDTNSHALTSSQAATLRAFVSKVVLEKIRGNFGDKWLKRILVEGFADPRGSYIDNLNLSLQRSERVLCVLLASPKLVPDALSDLDRRSTRELFLVGGSSFNAQKPSFDESRRIELRLEFLELGKVRKTPPDAQLDDAPCPLDRLR